MISGRITTRQWRGGTIFVRPGFTLTELLTAVTIIIILMAVLAVALHRGLSASKNASAQSLLNAIGMGVESFKVDLGYEPPLVTPQLVGAGKQGLVTPETYYAQNTSGTVNDLLAREDVRYHSEYTLAAYLLGIGDFNNDGNYGLNPIAEDDQPDWNNDGQAGLGFKSPGRSKAWKNPDPNTGLVVHNPARTGRTYHAYLDSVSLGGDGKVQSKFLELDETRGLYRLIDPWGNPIRYYKGWPTETLVGGVPVTPRKQNAEHVPLPLRTRASVEREMQLRFGSATDPPGEDVEVISLTPAMRAPYGIVSAGGYANEWVMEDLYASGTPVRPVAPFGDLISTKDSQSAKAVDTAMLGVMGEGTYLEHAESLERMLDSNLRYFP